MTSDELNAAIAAICDDPTRFEVYGGKAIAYIGWYWRPVDFDSEWSLGMFDDGDVGFMERNKWGYDEFTPSESERREIRGRLEVAVTFPTEENLRAVYEAMLAARDARRGGR